MGQETSNHNKLSSRSYPIITMNDLFNKRIQNEGILKLRGVPFKNCIEIVGQRNALFLENVDITLKDLLESRLYTNKLFPKQDIERLIQNLTYTLAFLQQNGIPYKDIIASNIYYDDEIFKLLPNQLIPASTYLKFLTNNQKSSSLQNCQKEFIPLSPEMIIAFRCKQHQIVDMQILDKSLLILEVSTLLPSFQCYDRQTFEILDQVISERIQLVKQYYSEQVASIIANMLDYDYVERMNLKEMSIFINRQINKDKPIQTKQYPRTPKRSHQNQIENNQSKTTSYQPKNSNISKSRVSNINNDDSESHKNSYSREINQKRKNKSNKIYMNGGINVVQTEQEQLNISKQQRNKVYMKNTSAIVIKKDKQQTQNTQKFNHSSDILRQLSTNNIHKTPSRLKQSQLFNKNKPKYNIQNQDLRLPEENKKYTRSVLNNEQDYQNFQNIHDLYKKSAKVKNNTDYTRHRPNNLKSSQTKAFGNNKCMGQRDQNYPVSKYKHNDYGGSNEYAQRSQYSQSDRNNYYDESQRFNNQKVPLQGKDHENSLNRIKTEIQRSRKLIQQFKRGQNSHY